MHSSRMRTGRSLTICLSLRGGGGVPKKSKKKLGGNAPPGTTPPCTTPRTSHPPPVNRITDTSKNITLATTSLRPVKIEPDDETKNLGANCTPERAILKKVKQDLQVLRNRYSCTIHMKLVSNIKRILLKV